MEVHKPAHVVLLSSPGLGHLIPIIELGNGFVLHHNFKVTVLAVTSQTSDAETHILNSALTTNHCHVIEIPSPDLTRLVHENDAVVKRLCVMMCVAKPAIRSILSKITPRPSTLIVDIFSTDAIPIARELNLLSYVYVASHAWLLALVVYSPVLDTLVEGQYGDKKEPLKISGCNPVRPEDVVDPMLDRNDRQYKEYLGIGNGIPKSDGILNNTWDDLQHKDLEAVRHGGLLSQVLNMKIPVYGVGPLVRQPESETSHSIESLVQWLDEQPSESVLYVSFGSGGTMSYEQMRELAWGLELSERRFVWVVRAPMEGVADAAFFTSGNSEGDEVSKYLPEGFLSRTSKVGLLVPQWAPQISILRHGSIGGFLSHCGWGSTLESITNVVPLIVWPLYSEQRMNTTLLVEQLCLAVRPTVLPTKKVVGREEIAHMMRQVIPGDENVKENPIRKRVKEIQCSAEKALSQGGSSFVALSQVVKTIEG